MQKSLGSPKRELHARTKQEEWYHIADEFNKRANFPNYIGSIRRETHTDYEAGT
jgi:hypothetical protein